MAIGSSLTKDVRKTGGNKNHKPQLEWPSSDSSKTNSSVRKRSNQGDSDSEATSSMHGSTSSATSSIDRYISRVEGGIQRKKTLDNLNSMKPTSFGSSRQSRRRPQSPLKTLLDNFQKPEHKFTSSGSLRSLKILRSKRATFSSVLKDSKFPEQVNPPEVKVTKSEEVVSVAKLCLYQHCSLHGHHQNPPHQHFPYLKRRSSENPKNIIPKTQTTGKQSVKKTEVKVTKKVTSKVRKNKNADYSIEFYAKTRSDPSSEAIRGCTDAHRADIMFCVSDNNQNEARKIYNFQDSGDTNDGKDENEGANNVSGAKKGKPKGWSYVKKVMLVRRFITELENAKKHIALVPEPEAKIASSRCESIGEKKNSNEWMLDYALQQVVGELAPTQKRKVALLVKAFETMTPK